ncbi:hypothetical protein V1286_002998 [Bradyrhizobium algeriense]|uniref:Uncharacterized protein n=1 Tax=Bradyrhizobium algeriense TaxID=634784 RepID=A0ABU8BAB0_9BRAD
MGHKRLLEARFSPVSGHYQLDSATIGVASMRHTPSCQGLLA